MRKISKELLLIVICLIIIMLVCADILTDFSQNPTVTLIQVYFSKQKQPVHLPAGSESGQQRGWFY